MVYGLEVLCGLLLLSPKLCVMSALKGLALRFTCILIRSVLNPVYLISAVLVCVMPLNILKDRFCEVSSINPLTAGAAYLRAPILLGH